MVIRKKFNWFDVASVIFLVLIGLTLIWEPFFITFQYQDVSYHLLVAQGYERVGGIVTWDFWESLPDGRPQNYPPLFHLLISFLVKLQLTPYFIIRFISWLSIVGSLALAWFGLRCLFNSRTAFFFLLLASAFSTYLIFLGVLLTASFNLAASCLLLFLIQKNRLFGATALLAIMFYTHMIMPFFVVGALLFWLIFNRSYFKAVAKVVVVALIFYSPWALHILFNSTHVLYTNKHYVANYPVAEFNASLSLFLLFVVALAYIIWHFDKDKKTSLIFFFGLFLVQVPILFSKFPSRFTISGGFFAAIVIIAYFFDSWLKTQKHQSLKRGLIVIVFILANLFSYEIFVIPATQSVDLMWEKGFFYRAIDLKKAGPFALDKISYRFYNSTNLQLASLISANSSADQVIYNISDSLSTFRYEDYRRYSIGQLFAALTNRSMANFRLPEYYWRQPLPFDQIAIVIADYTQTNFSKSEKNEVQKQVATTLEENFEPISDSTTLVIFKNKNPETFRIKPVKPVINQWLALVIFLAFVSVVTLETRKALKS